MLRPFEWSTTHSFLFRERGTPIQVAATGALTLLNAHGRVLASKTYGGAGAGAEGA